MIHYFLWKCLNTQVLCRGQRHQHDNGPQMFENRTKRGKELWAWHLLILFDVVYHSGRRQTQHLGCLSPSLKCFVWWLWPVGAESTPLCTTVNAILLCYIMANESQCWVQYQPLQAAHAHTHPLSTDRRKRLAAEQHWMVLGSLKLTKLSLHKSGFVVGVVRWWILKSDVGIKHEISLTETE